jgi:MFS family permease
MSGKWISKGIQFAFTVTANQMSGVSQLHATGHRALTMATVEATSTGSAWGPRDHGHIAPLLTPTLVGVFITMYLPLFNFYLLLSALPALVSSNGAAHSGAGLTTGVLMTATVISELAVPSWASRWGYRRLTQVALLLLALPTLALWLSLDMSVGLLVCAVRGVGLGIAFVLGSSLGAAKPASPNWRPPSMHAFSFPVPSGLSRVPLGGKVAAHR